MWNVPVDGVLSTTVAGGWAGGYMLPPGARWRRWSLYRHPIQQEQPPRDRATASRDGASRAAVPETDDAAWYPMEKKKKKKKKFICHEQ